MRVGVQREACRKMPQHTRHGFDVHTVLQCQRCEGVPLCTANINQRVTHGNQPVFVSFGSPD